MKKNIFIKPTRSEVTEGKTETNKMSELLKESKESKENVEETAVLSNEIVVEDGSF